jgi:hypothetical protein
MRNCRRVEIVGWPGRTNGGALGWFDRVWRGNVESCLRCFNAPVAGRNLKFSVAHKPREGRLLPGLRLGAAGVIQSDSLFSPDKLKALQESLVFMSVCYEVLIPFRYIAALAIPADGRSLPTSPLLWNFFVVS